MASMLSGIKLVDRGQAEALAREEDKARRACGQEGEEGPAQKGGAEQKRAERVEVRAHVPAAAAAAAAKLRRQRCLLGLPAALPDVRPCRRTRSKSRGKSVTTAPTLMAAAAAAAAATAVVRLAGGSAASSGPTQTTAAAATATAAEARVAAAVLLAACSVRTG